MKGVGELVPKYYMPSPMYSPQQQRLAYLEQQQSYNSVPQQQIYLKGRPVASIDEARASMIDFDGYVKKIGKKDYPSSLFFIGNLVIR